MDVVCFWNGRDEDGGGGGGEAVTLISLEPLCITTSCPVGILIGIWAL